MNMIRMLRDTLLSLALVMLVSLYQPVNIHASIIEARVDDAKSMIDGSKSVKVIRILASWCSHCQSTFPQFLSFVESNRGVSFFVISIDNDIGQAKSFINRYLNGKNIPNAKFLYFNEDNFIKFLYEYKIRYNGAIPYTAVMDTHSKVISTGNLSFNEINSAISSLGK